ncbi:hypothetical protein [Anaerosalibacter sp. Marseille-P3206]|uniref:hypothetical protein n=1 Tax=Anaerosalibacter sp. Marseille-P3206 TaxID=1871005 RepID=UPI0009871CA1|nr:hypothetical protein [Anaerosalibacter sp. Marseille-P3206]
MERKDYTLGVVLIFIGVMFFLLNLNVLTFNWLLLILGVALLIAYGFKRQTGYLAAGLILLGISIVSIIDEYTFTNVNIKGFVFLWIIGIVSLVMYSRHKTRGYLVFGCLLPAIGTYTLIDEMSYGDTAWVLFLFLAIALYIMYALEYKKLGIDWPRSLSIIMIVLSALFLLSSKTVIKFKFWKFISYLWPILLIVIGGRIIYNMNKTNE